MEGTAFRFVGCPYEYTDMYALERLKKTVEAVTGIGKPSARAVRESIRRRKPNTARFHDDGSIPNNPKLPFVHYRSPLRLPAGSDPAAMFEELFGRNGWKDSWRNGIYDYAHYHSRTHEVMGIARGRARVRFGGNRGRVFNLRAGDVAILPAGTGHQCLSASKDLLVVGAYPPSGKYDECTGSPIEHERAVPSIRKVPLPKKDPVYGADGPLLDLWRTRRA
jgi:uncharacterized protein YjlB